MLHWDEKILPEITGGGSVDRIAVLVTGNGQEKLLGVPKVPAGTGVEAARLCVDLFQEHNLTERIKGLSFDTTPSNAGIHVGACVKIE